MEGTINMTSNTSNITAAASAPNNHQQEAAVVVPTPTTKEQASNTKNKKLRAEQQAGGCEEPKRRPQQDTVVLCARCDSTNTKFCYYNNYNLNQPRYFCKKCRRYWTQGGALRLVPIGGGCRRNKRASGSSSSAATSSTAATPAQMENTVTTPAATTQLMLTAGSTMSVSSPTTGLLFPNDVLPKFTPKGGSGGLELAMDEKKDFLPLAPLSSSGDQPPEELAPEESDMTPFLDMLTGGGFFYVGGGSSSSYGGDLDMSGGINGMDLSFLLPEAGVPAIDPMQTQLMEGMDNASGELQWPSSELDNYMNYINEDGGYAAGPGAGVEQQQQVAGDQQQEEENKAKESSSSNNNNDDGGSSVYNYWVNNTNNDDGAEG